MLYVRHSLAPELRSQVLLLECSSGRQGLHLCTFAMLFPTARVFFPLWVIVSNHSSQSVGFNNTVLTIPLNTVLSTLNRFSILYFIPSP